MIDTTNSQNPGVQPLKKYRWTKQPNGRFAIFDVEVFEPYESEDRGELSEADVDGVIEKFEHEKIRGHWPRAHTCHHQDGSADNRDPVGFIDNLRYDHQEKVFFADLVDIYPDKFEKIKDRTYPYRSAEFNGEKILSVALLSTQSPYFKRPMIVLESEPVELSDRESLQFSERSKILCFQENKMDENKDCEIKEKYQEDPPEPIEDEGAIDDEGAGEDPVDDPFAEISAKLDQLISMLGQGGGTPPPAQPPAEPPAPVAMQDTVITAVGDVKKFQARLERRLDAIEQASQNTQIRRRVEAMCEENPHLDYDTLVSQAEKFSTANDREAFLSFVESGTRKFAAHPMSSILENYAHQDAGEDVDEETKEELQKFQDAPMHVRKVIRRARKDYADTIQGNPHNARKFQAQWGTRENFVLACAKEESRERGWYDKVICGRG